MKIILRYSLSLFLMLFVVQFSQAQCQSDECVSKISNGYIFLKSYKMEQVGNDTEYSYVFSKDTNYMLVTCNKEGSSNNVVVTLMDASKKVIATNYDPGANKFYPALAYNCKATGIYYLKYSFKENPGCCVSVLAFKK
jgi:hypothetical protein